MIWPRIVTKPTGQAGLALTVRDRVVPVGTRDFSNRCCVDVLPGHDVVLFSPQKRTDDSPTLAISRLPLAWLPERESGYPERDPNQSDAGAGDVKCDERAYLVDDRHLALGGGDWADEEADEMEI